jgi:hypothetical protein
MGRPQHWVRNNSSGSPPLEDVVCPLWAPCWVVARFHSRGGREDEQARQSGAIVLGFEVDMSFDHFQRLTVKLASARPRPQPQP